MRLLYKDKRKYMQVMRICRITVDIRFEGVEIVVFAEASSQVFVP